MHIIVGKNMRRLSVSHLRRALTGKKVRFIAVGVLNTLVDFTIFNILIHALGMAPWVANLCSTSVAMVVSFLLNKHAVFKGGRSYSHRQFAAYVLVTAAGLWGLQTAVILVVSGALRPVLHTVTGGNVSAPAMHLLVANIAKATATVLSAIWNYLWYDRVIFAHSSAKSKVTEWM